MVAILLWVLYYTARHLIPKKFRIHETSFKNFLKDFGFLTGVMVKETDTVFETMQKGKALFEYFFDLKSHPMSLEHELKMFVRDYSESSLVIHDNHTFVNAILPKIETFATQSVIQEIDPSQKLIKMEFSLSEEEKKVSLFFIKMKNERTDKNHYYSKFACAADFKYEQLINMLFSLFDNRLYLTVKHDELQVERLEQEYNQQNYLLPVDIFNKLNTEISEFRKRGIQRSYILYGPPGTGKTTMALELSKRCSGKILKLDAKVFTELSQRQTKSIIEGLNSDFIIVDDIDRIVISDLSSFLYMLESLKNFKNKPAFLASVNSFKRMDKAIIRPGRFDEIIEFKLPNTKQRIEFIMGMCEKMEINITPEDANKIAEETVGMSQSYLKEYCTVLSIEENVDAVINKIRNRQKYVKMAQKDMYDENDLEEYTQEESDD
jgi:adenylate kinase family enzyme